MKKIVTFIGALIVFTSLFSCKDVSEIEDQKLDVSAKSEGIVIAIPYVENLSYLNIFRTDESDKTYNIGQITPLKNEMSSFLFTDSLVESGSKYKYFVRYNVKGAYKFSSVSAIIEAIGSLHEDTVSVGVSDRFTFKSSDMTLDPSDTMSGKTGFHIAIAVALQDGTASTFTVSAEDGNLTGAITLSSILTSNFMNKSIALKGLLLEKTAKSENETYKVITWSKPVVVQVMSEDGSEDVTNGFTVTNGTAGGEYDYSGRAAVVTQPETFDYSN